MTKRNLLQRECYVFIPNDFKDIFDDIEPIEPKEYIDKISKHLTMIIDGFTKKHGKGKVRQEVDVEYGSSCCERDQYRLCFYFYTEETDKELERRQKIERQIKKEELDRERKEAERKKKMREDKKLKEFETYQKLKIKFEKNNV